MKINELHNQPVKADTYEASMALNQLLKIGKHAIKLHNMIDDDAEMESWVAKKIDLAGDYVKKVHGYMQGEKAGLYDDGGMSEARLQSNYAVSFQYPKGNHRRNSFASKDDAEKFADAVKNKGGIVDPIRLALGKNADDLSTSIRSLGEDAEEKTPQEKLAIMSKIEKIKKQSKDLAGDKDKDLIDKNKKILATLTKKLHEDAGDLTDQQKQGLTLLAKKYSGRKGVNGDPLIQGWIKARSTTGVTSDGWDSEEVQAWEKRTGKELSDWSPEDDKQFINQNEISRDMEDELLKVMGDPDFADKPIAGEVLDFLDDSMESVSEDAGEGHMSKSTLYHTAKYAIELMDMINKGDDLEGWVQSKLNKAADYLQGVHNYEEYQKLNPYREELDSNVLQKHAGIVQKNIDEILARETRLDDVDTKPGMMRILAKRVNEVEKEMAKENRKNTDEADSDRSMTKGEMKKREKIVKGMKKNKAGFKKRYGKDAEAVMYATATKNAMKDDEQMEEGLKDWAKKTAMAGVIIAGLAGVGSIQDAIDSSVPAVQAMEKALEMAQDQGNDELAQMIEKDLSAVKVRLSSGKDLNFVKGMQDKYSKFLVKEYRIERPMSDKEARMKALQDIQMDPNTSKDKELMAKLAKELKKLRTQKDS